MIGRSSLHGGAFLMGRTRRPCIDPIPWRRGTGGSAIWKGVVRPRRTRLGAVSPTRTCSSERGAARRCGFGRRTVKPPERVVGFGHTTKLTRPINGQAVWADKTSSRPSSANTFRRTSSAMRSGWRRQRSPL